MNRLSKIFSKNSLVVLCIALFIGFIYGSVLSAIYLDEYQVWQSRPRALLMTFLVLMSTVLGCWLSHLFTRRLEKKIIWAALHPRPPKD